MVNISSGLTNHGPDRQESSAKGPTLPESRQLLLRSLYSLLTLLRVDFVILRCKSQWQDFATQMWFSRKDIFHWPGAGQALMYLFYACLWSQQFYPSFFLPAYYSHWQLGDQEHNSLPYTQSLGLGAANNYDTHRLVPCGNDNLELTCT